MWGLRRRSETETLAAPRHPLPEACTPFTTLRYLRRIRGDASVAWTPERMRELDAEIRGLEARYFGRGPGEAEAGVTAGVDEAELGAVARRWAVMARQGGSS